MMRLRRLALAAQGLLQAQPYGRGLAGARNAINHIGYVQIDTISVVERAHNHTFHSRVPGFKPEMINKMLLNSDIFEYWSHAAAFLPISDFRFSLPYKHAIKSGQTHWHKNPDKKLMNELLVRIRSDGPLRSRDIEATNRKSTGWWDWKPAKRALEQLFMEGDLMVSNREGFQKIYDLTERVLPGSVDLTTPGIEEFAEHLLERQIRCHGLVSLKGLTYLRKNKGLREAMKTVINEKLVQGRLEEVRVNGGQNYLLEAGALERSIPRFSNRLHILSPFDNCVIQRERLKTLFNYEYQIECYVPAPKRKYGYFSLPLLYRNEFVGRMDCKAHRKKRHLEIKSLHFEKHNFEDDSVIFALTKTMRPFLNFQNCETVSLEKAYPTRLTQSVRRALAQI